MGATALMEKVHARRALPGPEARRALRLANGLALQDLADELNVSTECVRLWELGRRRPSGRNAVSYAALLASLREQL
jgi:DNA-binding transcriptional regulator YiaG